MEQTRLLMHSGSAGSAVAVARVLAAAFAGLVTIGAGFATVVFFVFDDVVAWTDFALAIRAGAFGCSRSAHGANT
jgi:hypothetical protein